jgi:excisionase family DNA binding protein
VAQATPEDSWITVRDMQRMLSLGRSKSYEILAREPEIETVQLGSAIRINKASLDRWIRKHRYPAWRQGASIADEGG